MEAADEEDYERYCQEAIFRIQILEQVPPPASHRWRRQREMCSHMHTL